MSEIKMDSLKLTPAQVETMTGVPKRRVNEMAEKGIIPSEQVGGGSIKVRRVFAFANLELIKQQYDANYPQRRPGINTKTTERINALESQVADLVDDVAWLYTELGLRRPDRNTPAEAPQTPSAASGG